MTVCDLWWDVARDPRQSCRGSLIQQPVSHTLLVSPTKLKTLVHTHFSLNSCSDSDRWMERAGLRGGDSDSMSLLAEQLLTWSLRLGMRTVSWLLRLPSACRLAPLQRQYRLTAVWGSPGQCEQYQHLLTLSRHCRSSYASRSTFELEHAVCYFPLRSTKHALKIDTKKWQELQQVGWERRKDEPMEGLNRQQ